MKITLGNNTYESNVMYYGSYITFDIIGYTHIIEFTPLREYFIKVSSNSTIPILVKSLSRNYEFNMWFYNGVNYNPFGGESFKLINGDNNKYLYTNQNGINYRIGGPFEINITPSMYNELWNETAPDKSVVSKEINILYDGRMLIPGGTIKSIKDLSNYTAFIPTSSIKKIDSIFNYTNSFQIIKTCASTDFITDKKRMDDILLIQYSVNNNKILEKRYAVSTYFVDYNNTTIKPAMIDLADHEEILVDGKKIKFNYTNWSHSWIINSQLVSDTVVKNWCRNNGILLKNGPIFEGSAFFNSVDEIAFITGFKP